MANKFLRKKVLNFFDFSLVAEEELLDCYNSGYDEGGKPPRFRIVLLVKEEAMVCVNISRLCEEINKLKFPIKSFALKYPGEVAEIIAHIAGHDRPVQDAAFFKSIENCFQVRLSDVVPKVRGEILEWFEWSGMIKKPLKRRRLRLDPDHCELIE